MIALIAGVITAYVTAWLAVPLLERVAWRFRLLDFPGARRHVHNRPVPRLGGIAVFVGFISGIVIAALVTDKGPTAARTFIDLDPRSVALVAAGTILFFIGLLDDLKDIEPAVKLAGQIVAAAVVCYFGFRIDAVSLPPASRGSSAGSRFQSRSCGSSASPTPSISSTASMASRAPFP
jgi:UDP-GlcNAc:undecaprenyl-phosphate GlcNAc-1-phosphate transferase